MIKQAFGDIVSFWPIAWALDIFKLMMTGRFIFLTICYFGFVIFTFHNGYSASKSLDQQYDTSNSDDYISISRDQCTAYYNTVDSSVYHVTNGVECNQLTDADYISSIYKKHMKQVRGIKIGGFWVYPLAFFLFFCIMYINTPHADLIHHPKRTLIKYCICWFIYAVMLYPSTFAAYGSVSIFYDDYGNKVSVSSGTVTNDGRWMRRYESYFGTLRYTKKWDSPSIIE